jgi:hypothetical protein
VAEGARPMPTEGRLLAKLALESRSNRRRCSRGVDSGGGLNDSFGRCAQHLWLSSFVRGLGKRGVFL